MIPTDEIRELCERLRDRDNTEDEFALCLEAAETIASLSERIRELEEALRASAGYLRNAKIDLETGATKATAIRTIDGGLKRVEAGLTQADEGENGAA